MAKPVESIHPLWPGFAQYAAEHGIGDLGEKWREDWEPWWLCFIAGADTYLEVHKDDPPGW